MRAIFLVDNGSLQPAATFNLRRVARLLGEQTALEITPASLLHSHKIPAADLDGTPAPTLAPQVSRAARAGVNDVVVVPFFFGPSKALTDYLPRRLGQIQQEWPELAVRVAAPLVDLEGALDLRLAEILCDGVRQHLTGGDPPSVALVDHGSPIPEVSAVRNVLAGQLAALLGDEVARLTPASMERREGDSYRFNEPLLENLLDRPGFNSGLVILSMLFLSPGRHAGEEGDVHAICAAARDRNPGLSTAMTALAGEDPRIVEILADRLQDALTGRRYLLDLPPDRKPAKNQPNGK
ncbi:cobalamin biosynthesis protein CbiX [Methylonatrum kenyense]|uniref:sirohydrochlorin chelatase n=1 Tax=Methylonatrum kenyense TaxID=455253 RepID=UPI0020BF35F8|nr:CbiX/SirB N-terminal domain-containing protein [Methylonatrum kenyense]MCK8516603.1 cobalamin biosynthesis protein CbiX [Methylonatrum kenyense]